MSEITFDSVTVGDEIPEWTTEPVTRHTLALYCGASGDHNPIHVDTDYAKKSGLDDVISHGMLSMGYLAEALVRWVPQSQLRSLQARFTAMTLVGDTVRCSGRVVEKFQEEGEKRVRLEVSTETPQGRTIFGDAVVSLP